MEGVIAVDGFDRVTVAELFERHTDEGRLAGLPRADQDERASLEAVIEQFLGDGALE